MMEIVSARWSSGLRIKDTGKKARVPRPGRPPQAPADSPLEGRLRCSPRPLQCSGALLKPGGDPYCSPASCLPSWPWDRALLAPFPGWVGDKKTESGKRRPLSKPPVTSTLRVRARPRGQCTAPSLRPSPPLEECVFGGSPAWW